MDFFTEGWFIGPKGLIVICLVGIALQLLQLSWAWVAYFYRKRKKK